MQLEINDLSKTYSNGRSTGAVEALQRVSLTIDQGMFSLLGPNGAQTTLRLYDNRITKAEAKSIGNGKYTVKMYVKSATEYYDKTGKELAKGKAPVVVDIAVLTDDGKNKDGLTTKVPLYIQKRSLTAGEHAIDVTVKSKPVKAGIDPYNKLIDCVSDNNLANVDIP